MFLSMKYIKHCDEKRVSPLDNIFQPGDPFNQELCCIPDLIHLPTSLFRKNKSFIKEKNVVI